MSKTTNKFAPEVRGRAVQMADNVQSGAMPSPLFKPMHPATV